jgi:NADH-ubiquinone oxidoreductase chain 5
MFPTPYIICLPVVLKFLTLFVCILGGLIGYLISFVSLFFYNKSLNNNKLISFFRIIWFIPFISTVYIRSLPLKIGGIIKFIDQG